MDLGRQRSPIELGLLFTVRQPGVCRNGSRQDGSICLRVNRPNPLPCAEVVTSYDTGVVIAGTDFSLVPKRLMLIAACCLLQF
jgi:hypothetical protein